MRSAMLLVGVVYWFGLAASAQAQSPPAKGAQVEELKQQLQLLQRQLQALEAAPEDLKTKRIGSTRMRPRGDALVVRLYDLSDLFAVVPSYPALKAVGLSEYAQPLFPAAGAAQGAASGIGGGGGGMGGGGFGGGFFDVPDRPRSVSDNKGTTILRQNGSTSVAATRISLDDLIKAITTTIDSDTWQEAGGSGTIARIGTSLLISTEESTHEQIESLLDLFRKRWGTLRTVSVRAQWLWLDDAQLQQLLPAQPAQAGAPRAYGLADTDAWGELQAQLQDPDSQIRKGYRAILTSYNGQTVSTVSGEETLVVKSLGVRTTEDTGESKGQAVYEPVATELQEGIALQITPMVTYSGKYVVLDVHSRVSRTLDPDRPPRNRRPETTGNPPSPREVAAGIDRPVIASQQLSTTLRIPVDRPMLAGGMTFRVNEEADAGEPSLYLFLTVSVQELRDDLPVERAQPALPAAVPAEPKKVEDPEETGTEPDSP